MVHVKTWIYKFYTILWFGRSVKTPLTLRTIFKKGKKRYIHSRARTNTNKVYLATHGSTVVKEKLLRQPLALSTKFQFTPLSLHEHSRIRVKLGAIHLVLMLAWHLGFIRGITGFLSLFYFPKSFLSWSFGGVKEHMRNTHTLHCI